MKTEPSVDRVIRHLARAATEARKGRLRSELRLRIGMVIHECFEERERKYGSKEPKVRRK